MYRFKRNRKFHVSNRLALAAALALCLSALAGGSEPRGETPFSRAVDTIVQHTEKQAEEAPRERRGLTASFLLLRGR